MTVAGSLIDVETIRSLIITLPGRPPFMLASDLANVYETETKRITETVKRNPNRFPDDFAFYLTADERKLVVSQKPQSAAFEQNQGPNYSLMAFTREGANMLSAVLHTPTAVARSVQIMRAFSRLEELAAKPVPTVEMMALELAALGREMRQAQGELQLIWQLVTRPVPPEPVPAITRRATPVRPAQDLEAGR